MNEQDYQLLIDLYETKNITKVADQHFLTQPALTKRLRRIEEELGSELLIRSRKGVVFNSVGESVVSYCRQMCEMNEQLRNSINASKGIVGGSLSIGTSINYCRYRLPSVMRTYTEKYPQVDISISTGHSQALFRQLSEGKFPLAILRGEYPWEEDGSFCPRSRSVLSAVRRTLTGILRSIPTSATTRTLMRKSG